MISVILVLAVAAAQAPADPATDVIQRPTWIRTPTVAQVAFAYPKAAKYAGQPIGQGTVACDITAEGRLDHCEIYKETPEGLGFGEAALKVAKYFQMKPVAADGKPVAGGRMVLPIVFRPPQGH